MTLEQMKRGQSNLDLASGDLTRARNALDASYQGRLQAVISLVDAMYLEVGREVPEDPELGGIREVEGPIKP